MSKLPSKNDVAKLLAGAHQEVEPAIKQIFRILSEQEDKVEEPLKLLEVNPETSPSGIVPIMFAPEPPNVPYASVIVEVTENEYASIEEGTLKLPHGWTLGDELCAAAR
jgi:hypothetical protein